MTQFYTYLHCKPDGTPFYVGKGHGKRAEKFSCRNVHHQNVVAKYGRENIDVFIFPRTSEQDALDTEIRWIGQFKREGIKLVNQTSGGDGVSGYKHTEENCIKSSMRSKAMWENPEMRIKHSILHTGNKYNLGKKHSEEQNVQNRLRLKDNRFAIGERTPEQKARIAAAIRESNKDPKVIANKAAGSIGNTNASGTRSNEFCATMKIKSRGNKNACGKRTPEQRARMSAGRLAAKLKGATP